MKLSDLKNGDKAYIADIEASPICKTRMKDLGFLNGESVERLYASPLGTPIVYRIMGQQVSLRRSEAECIGVTLEKRDSTCKQSVEESDTPLHPDYKLAEAGDCDTQCRSCVNATCPSCNNKGKGKSCENEITIALVGNPNCGKTAFFNSISGGHERTGNYAGVTVSSAVGHLSIDDKNLKLVDLPGTYSLHSLSPDEAFVMHELAKGKVDVIVNVIDVGNLDRNLLLTLQLLQIRKPMVCVLNMYDEFTANGGTLDVDQLQRRLGVPCVKTVARTGEGVKDAIRRGLEVAQSSDESILTHRITVDAGVDARHDKVNEILDGIYTRKSEGEHKRTHLIDRFTSHGPLAYIIFALVMVCVFYLTFELGSYPMDWIESGIALLGDFIGTTLPDGIFRDLIVDGIIGGVGSVIVFLPNILILYLCISLLEDSGYLARAAMLADPLFERIGLHGKSFIPMLMGFGCNVPAVMATRTISNRKTRLITMLSVPFMSCSARLPIYIVFCGAFFPDHAALVMTLLYFGGILLSLLFAWVVNLFYHKRSNDNFVMEIPPYRAPLAMSVVRNTWDKGLQYLKKMGGVILVASVVIWMLGYFPRGGEELTTAQQQEQSYLGKIGHAIEPVFSPMDFDWRMDVGILAGVGAKELMVSTMGILYECPEEDAEVESADEVQGTRLSAVLSETYSPATALAYMVFALLYFPCFATIVAIGAESGRRRMAIYTAIYTTIIAYLFSLLVYIIA
ncbi:MAG: ferrous iron transport protein B [Lepagella sp.]